MSQERELPDTAELAYCTVAAGELLERTGGRPALEEVRDLLIQERQKANRQLVYMFTGVRSATELASDALQVTVRDSSAGAAIANSRQLLKHVVEGMKQMEELTRALSDIPRAEPPFAELVGLVERARITLWSVASTYERVGAAVPERIERALAALGESEVDSGTEGRIWGEVVADRYLNELENDARKNR